MRNNSLTILLRENANGKKYYRAINDLNSFLVFFTCSFHKIQHFYENSDKITLSII